MLLVTQIDTFYNGLTLRHRDTINVATGGTFMQKTPEECYDLIENMTAHHNYWDTSATQDEMSRTISSTTTESPKMQMQSPSGSRSLPSNTVANPRGDLKAITTRSGVAYDRPTIPPSHSPLPKEVKHETKATKDKDEWKKLHEYYNGYWPKQIAGLKRTYFSNPWSMIALFAGIVLFILTLVLTIFTVRSAGFHQNPEKLSFMAVSEVATSLGVKFTPALSSSVAEWKFGNIKSSERKPYEESSTQVPKGSGNPNPTTSSSNSLDDQMETLTVESPIPTDSSPVPTACLNDSSKPFSEARLVLERVANQEETPTLDNILSLTNRFEDILGVSTSSDEIIRVAADVSNMEASISASPTPTLRIHKDHPKNQIIGPVDTQIQTRHKSKMVEEQSFMATIHQKTDPALLYFFARIEAIRLFLAYASFMGFTVYQMNVKSAFLYGTIDEEVYVMQPPGFQDPTYPAKVYKVEKAMYGLHQAPRAWYGTLSKYLLKNGFQRGTIDQTLFIRRQKEDFILVQVYVDDIIFGSSNLQMCREFEALMHEKFQMSAMGELNFFLGLQVLQKEDGIFLSQDKYIGDILKKFGFSDVRSSNTPMDKENPWGKNGPGKDVELHLYRSMIGSLMYLTTSRPDIMFAVCAYARHQVAPKECHLHAVKRIFRYLKGHPKLELWYPKASPFDLVAYLDSDYGGAS
nr:putative ribonuclease H-like domain-containing protein [Tanacetum cinerariifolium]